MKIFVQKKLTLKESFKNTDLFKKGNIFINSRNKRKNHGLSSFELLKYYNQPFKFNVHSGQAETIEALNDGNLLKILIYQPKLIK
jgi:hypothetical protein